MQFVLNFSSGATHNYAIKALKPATKVSNKHVGGRAEQRGCDPLRHAPPHPNSQERVDDNEEYGARKPANNIGASDIGETWGT
jgi:hypothetical protein